MTNTRKVRRSQILYLNRKRKTTKICTCLETPKDKTGKNLPRIKSSFGGAVPFSEILQKATLFTIVLFYNIWFKHVWNVCTQVIYKVLNFSANNFMIEAFISSQIGGGEQY